MNKQIIEGNWKQFKGKVKRKWGKLTNDQIDQIDGDREKLLGAIEECYGIERDEAKRELEELESRHAA